MVRGHFNFNVSISVFVQGKLEIVLLLGNIVKIKASFQNTSLYLCYALNLGQIKLMLKFNSFTNGSVVGCDDIAYKPALE